VTRTRLVTAALLCALSVTACSDDTSSARRDPLTATGVVPGASPLYSEGLDTLAPPETGGPPPFFRLFTTSEGCLIASFAERARSECLSLRPGDGSSMLDGGVHGDASLAWLSTGDPDVASARFWMLDGSTYDQQPLVADGVEDPPVVFGHAVPATNEIVGVELLDADGHVLFAIPVDGGA
jgi:hypothetical protein